MEPGTGRKEGLGTSWQYCKSLVTATIFQLKKAWAFGWRANRAKEGRLGGKKIGFSLFIGLQNRRRFYKTIIKNKKLYYI